MDLTERWESLVQAIRMQYAAHSFDPNFNFEHEITSSATQTLIP